MKHPEKAVRAFVQMKSMKAREDMLIAYHDGDFKRWVVTKLLGRHDFYEKQM
jgi:hypothetical protein